MALDILREMEKYNIMKCVDLQKVRWKDVRIFKILQITKFNVKCQNGYSLETGLHKSIIHAVKDFKDINLRPLTLTLKIDNVNILLLINVHAPTKEKDEGKKEYLYATLCQCVRLLRMKH